MRILFFIFVLFLINPVHGGEYGVYNQNNYNDFIGSDKILFILDFSNSMNEHIDGSRKVDLMINTMFKLIPKIPAGTQVGLRVYGHRYGFTPIDACRASSLLIPVGDVNYRGIQTRLNSLSPRGMTPITYSLKQAVRKDFVGISGNKRIILLTDGGENCDESPCKYAMELLKVRRDISIDVIAFKNQDEEDLEQLECASLVTSGRFYTANTAAELANSLHKSISAKKEVEAKIIMH